VQLAERVGLVDVHLGGHVDQGGLVRALRQMAVDRVMAQVGGGVDEPARERRMRIVEHARKRLLPFDQLRFFGPERFG